MKGLPLEFGISVRGPKCFNDGATRWFKKFSDRFSRFDTIPAVTNSQPPSHVVVGITLNAKASSLKTRYQSINRLIQTTQIHKQQKKKEVKTRRQMPCEIK